MAKSILANMFGEFTLQEEGASDVVRANLTGKSRRLWILIAYLIVNRDRGVTPEELIDLLWSDPVGDNPTATLQNNVSRARALLQKEGFNDARDLFKYENGLYYWAPQRTTVVDTEEFEAYVDRFQTKVEPKDVDEALKACALYKGGFLAQASDENWCVNLRNHYQALFIRLCDLTVQTLLEEGRLAEAQELSKRAIVIDPASEIFSVYLMRALVLAGNPKQALDHYDFIKHLFESEYNVSVSSDLEFEKAAASQALYGRDLSEGAIRSFLLEDANERGAFLCNNEVFRSIVQRYVREMPRFDLDAQLLVIGFDQEGTLSAHHMTHMKRLEKTLLEELRVGDPFTKMNSVQFLVMLPSATREDGDVVVNRIIDRFHQDYPQMQTDFHIFLFDLASFSDEILNS